MDKNKKLSYITTYVLLIVLYFILFSLINSGFISRYQVGILILILINVILAASLNVTVGCLGQITLGHAGFMSIGAYTAALLTKSGFSFRVSRLHCSFNNWWTCSRSHRIYNRNTCFKTYWRLSCYYNFSFWRNY